MSNKKYTLNEIEEIRLLRHLSIKEIAKATGKTEKEIIYIKQAYRIYKDWQVAS